MAFTNRIRLPLQLHSPQFPEDRQVFRKANGQTQTMSIVVRKTYELETDFMPENWHQKLKIALAHDTVFIEGEKYLGDISQDGDYTIDWPDSVLHYPTAKANTKVQATPFDATNANCQSCDQASQLNLQDDQAAGIYDSNLEEDQDYSVDVAANDDICCYPAKFSLVSFNSDYLDSASIDENTGELAIHTKTGLISANGITLATYRVTCPNGSYDDAVVKGNINGSIEGCLAPTGLSVESTGPTAGLACWDQMGTSTDFYWELYTGSSPVGSPVQTGNLTEMDDILNCVSLSGLDPDTIYYFQVRTVCYGIESNFVGNSFATPDNDSDACGQYNINYSDSTFTGPPFVNVSYTDCNGNDQVVSIPNNSDRFVCALQTAAGLPVNLSSTNPDVIINYTTLC